MTSKLRSAVCGSRTPLLPTDMASRTTSASYLYINSLGFTGCNPVVFRLLLGRVARSLTKRGGERLIRDQEVVDQLAGEVEDTDNPAEARRRLQRALDNGRLSRREVERAEEAIMTDFNSFMSIGLEQCGSDKETFSELVEVWNRQKDEIREMSQAEVRRTLQCP